MYLFRVDFLIFKKMFAEVFTLKHQYPIMQKSKGGKNGRRKS